MKTIKTNILALLAATLLASACDRFESDQTAPAYLKIDAITVVDNSADSWSSESGFFTCDIDAVNLIVWQEGDASETNLGTFNLPCTVPVMKHGNIDYVRVVPVVRQNGIAGSRIAYPYYKTITLDDVTLTVDSVTCFDTIRTQYMPSSTMRVVWSEFFEPGPSAVKLDTAVQRLVYKPDTILSGYGCGVIRVPDSVKTINFWSDSTCNVPTPGVALYLELDYWSDFDFSIGLNNPIYNGGSNEIMSAVTLFGKPEAGWQKIYINLGRIWGPRYRYYPHIRLFFSVFNPNGKAGNLYIDNMKLLTI